MNKNPIKDASGRFVRIRKIWDGSDWNDGHIDNKGRFRVYRPDYPRAYAMGYAMRAHVVYWLKTGKVHPPGTVLHHINEVKTDDRFDNLEVKDHGKHSTDHHTLPPIYRDCLHCGKSFIQPRNREKARIDSRKFCSHDCYHKHGRSDAFKEAASKRVKREWATGKRKRRWRWKIKCVS